MPCKKCGSTERETCDGKCRPCSNIRTRAAYHNADPATRRRHTEAWEKRERAKPISNFKIAERLRSRFFVALKGNAKSGSAVRDLGCTIPEFKGYIEMIFLPGMTWENWTFDGWHLDHVKPLASFNLSNPEQCREALHWTNYQPLWGVDNMRKGDRVNPALTISINAR